MDVPSPILSSALTSVCQAVLFTMARLWNQPSWPHADEIFFTIIFIYICVWMKAEDGSGAHTVKVHDTVEWKYRCKATTLYNEDLLIKIKARGWGDGSVGSVFCTSRRTWVWALAPPCWNQECWGPPLNAVQAAWGGRAETGGSVVLSDWII